MISKLTQLFGEMCLILSKNRTAYRYAVVKKSRPQRFQSGTKFFHTLLILMISFVGFNNEAFAQCIMPDIVSPSAACITATTLTLDTNGNGVLLVSDIDNGSADACGIATFALNKSTFNCNDIGNITISLTVTDGAGNSNFCFANVLVRDQLAPAVICPADITVDCGDPTTVANTGNATATDNCNPNPSITSADMVVMGMNANCQTIERTFTATDNAFIPNDTVCIQTITIVDTVDPVLDFGAMMGPADITLSCSDAIPVAPTAMMTDNCAASATIFAVDLVTQDTLNTSCGFYDYTIIRTWTAEDNCGNQDVHTQIITIENSPVFMGAATALNFSAISTAACPNSCTAEVELDLTSNLMYNCGIMGSILDVTSVEVLDATGAVVFSDPDTLLVSACLDVGVYDANFLAIDFCGNQVMHTVQLTIQDNTPPIANCLNNISIALPSVGQYIIDPENDLDNNSTDNCATQLIYSVDIPALDCTVMGQMIGNNLNVVMTVSDGTLTSSCTTNITILDNPPVPFCQDITISLDAAGNFTVPAMDIDNASIDQCNDPLSFLISRDSVSFNANLSLDCSDVGIVPAVLQVTDNGGMSSICFAEITVVDDLDPMALCGFTNYPVTLDNNGMYTFDSGDSTRFQTLFSDNCPFTIVSSVNVFDCSDVDLPNGVPTTITVVDANGNPILDAMGSMITCDINVMVSDSTPPILDCADVTVSVDGTGSVTLDPEELLAGSIFFQSGNNGSGTAGAQEICINVANVTTLSFDFVYFSTDPDSAAADGFGYSVNGVSTNLVDSVVGITSGPINVPLSAGDQFCLFINTVDNLDGSATVVVDNFNAALIGDFAIANWTTTTSSNSDGTLFFHDACGIDRYEIRCVGTPTWSSTLTYNCNDLANLFGGALCGPQTKGFEIQAFDVHGNVSLNTCTSNVTFIDKQPPVPICDAKTISLSSDSLTVSAILFDDGSFDTCGDIDPNRFGISIGGSPFQQNLTLDCADVGVNPITLRVEDCSGNMAFCQTTVTIQENQPPKLHCPSDITIDCTEMAQPVNTGFPTLVIDACSATVDTAFVDVISGPGPGCRLIERTWTATDLSGNQNSCLQLITVEDNIAPTFTVPTDVTLTMCEDDDDLTITGDVTDQNDACTRNPRLSVTHHDAGFVDSYVFGNWTFNQVSSNTAFSSGNTFGTDSLQLMGANNGPCMAMPSMNTVESNYTITIPFDGDVEFDWSFVSSDSTGTGSDDPFGYILNGTFTQLTGAAATMSGTTIVPVVTGDVFEFSQQTNTSTCGGATTTIKNFRGPEGCTSSFIRTWTVADDCGNSTTDFQTITYDVTSQPIITFTNSLQSVSTGNGTCSGAAAIDFSNAVTGNCGIIEITNDAMANFGVGDGMTDASGDYPVGMHTITYSIVSPLGCFNDTTHVITLDVIDNTSPFLTCTNSLQTVFLNSAGQGALLTTPGLYSAFDDCGIAQVDIMPVTFDCSDVGMVPNVVLTVTDASGNTNTCNLNVEVASSSNTAATITCPADVTVDCSNFTPSGNFGMATSGGVCGANNVSIQSTIITSGAFDDCFDADRTWTNGSSTCVQTITVMDTIAPILAAAPADITIDFSNPNLATQLGFTDNCASNSMVTSTDDTSNQGTDPCMCSFYNFDITRSWIAMDNCGLQDTATQIITVQDVSAPTFSFPDTISFNNDPGLCGATVAIMIDNFIADDAPFTCLTITNDGLTNNGIGNGTDDIDGFYAVGEYDITFVVTDPCGNVSTEVLHLEIVDNENIALPCFSFINVTLDNTGNAVITENQLLNGPIQDNCSMQGNFTFTLSTSAFNCSDIAVPTNVTLTATDQNGNSNSCITTVNISSMTITFNTSSSSTSATNLLANDGTATIMATGGSGSFSFLWDDPSAQTTATAVGLAPGLYTVVVTDTTTGCTQSVEVVVPSLCPTFSIGTGAGVTGDMISIPVTVDNFTNVVSFQFTLNVDSSVAQFMGGSNFNLPGFAANNFSVVMSAGGVITVSWIDPGGAPGTTLPTGTTVFDIDLLITGNPGTNSPIFINSTPVNYEIGQFLNGAVVSVPACSNPGMVSVTTSLAVAQFCGNLTTEFGTPIQNIQVEETISGTISTTDANGDYCLNLSTGVPVCIEPSKTANHFGSSSIDLFLIQQHILGNTLFTSPYTVIAADANNSGSVTTLDLVDLQFLILGNFSTLPNNDFWRFVDATQTFANPLSPFPYNDKINAPSINMDLFNQDFVAVAIGDVNGTAQPLRPDGSATAYRGDNSFDLQLDDQAVKKGASFEVTFSASEIADLAGYQMTLEFNTASLQFENVEALHLDNLTENNFAINNAADGIISLNWFGLQTQDFNGDEALFTLKFTALEEIKSLKGLLSSTSSITNAEAYKMTNNEIEYLNLNLNFNDASNISTEFALFDNQPNPFRNETMISFTLPSDEMTTITVYDVSGRVLMQVNNEFYKGYNELPINASELNGSGILYYEVKTQRNTATGRMILLK